MGEAHWHVLQLDLREPSAQQLLLSTLKCLMPALVVSAPVRHCFPSKGYAASVAYLGLLRTLLAEICGHRQRSTFALMAVLAASSVERYSHLVTGALPHL